MQYVKYKQINIREPLMLQLKIIYFIFYTIDYIESTFYSKGLFNLKEIYAVFIHKVYGGHKAYFIAHDMTIKLFTN